MPKEERDERTGTPARRQESLTRRDVWGWSDPWASPFGMMRRLNDEMDRIFGGWGTAGTELARWSPALETFQRGDEFVVRADLPGLSKEDIDVEISDDTLTICGERSHESKEDREGFYRSECSYGSFSRVIPLPEGAIGESAKASFRNGVLEVVLQAPPKETRQARKIDVTTS